MPIQADAAAVFGRTWDFDYNGINGAGRPYRAVVDERANTLTIFEIATSAQLARQTFLYSDPSGAQLVAVVDGIMAGVLGVDPL